METQKSGDTERDGERGGRGEAWRETERTRGTETEGHVNRETDTEGARWGEAEAMRWP